MPRRRIGAGVVLKNFITVWFIASFHLCFFAVYPLTHSAIYSGSSTFSWFFYCFNINGMNALTGLQDLQKCILVKIYFKTSPRSSFLVLWVSTSFGRDKIVK